MGGGYLCSCLVDHAGVPLLLGEVPAAPLPLHVLEVHQLEGVLVGAAAAHHRGHLCVHSQ